jgi:uncharacterized membrane protein
VSASSGLERSVEVVLTSGLTLSGGLLLAGLLLDSSPLLRWGILLLMLTPLMRVVVVTVALFRARDWTFAFVSLWVLLVLGTGLLAAAHR